MVKATRTIIAKEGSSALLTGFGPTAVGYLVQGGAKVGQRIFPNVQDQLTYQP